MASNEDNRPLYSLILKVLRKAVECSFTDQTV